MTNTRRLYLLLAGFLIGGLLVLIGSGCASSPDIVINIDKSIYVENANDIDVDYKTQSGVDSDAKFDGEVSPDITIPIPIP